MTPAVPKSRISCLVSENEHQTYDNGEGWDLNTVRDHDLLVEPDNSHNTAWEIEVTVYVLIHINDECCQNGMYGNWEEYCYKACQKLADQLKGDFILP
jgi:hypothetical protein